MQPKLFSVIIVSLNAEATIRATIDSTLQQTCDDWEIIVKDGKSGDGTLAQIPKDERIHVFTQADTSVYDAMNQAVEHASGKFLIFMNCGDCFAAPDVLTSVRELIEVKQIADHAVIYGDYIKDNKSFEQNPQVDRKHFRQEGLCHQSVFFGRSLFERFGNYDTKFRICADYEIMTRFFVNGTRFHYIAMPVCSYQGGGISEQPKNIDRVRAEGNWVRQKYFTFFERMMYQCRRIQNRLMKSVHV